jgi:hypothetical protein
MTMSTGPGTVAVVPTTGPADQADDRSMSQGTDTRDRVEAEDLTDDHGLTQWHPAVPGTSPAWRPAFASSGRRRC